MSDTGMHVSQYITSDTKSDTRHALDDKCPYTLIGGVRYHFDHLERSREIFEEVLAVIIQAEKIQAEIQAEIQAAEIQAYADAHDGE